MFVFVEAGFGFAEQLNRLLGGHQPLQHHIGNGAAGGGAQGRIDRFHLDHNHGIFDAVEPEPFLIFENAKIRLLNVRFALPDSLIPEATKFPNSTHAPTF